MTIKKSVEADLKQAMLSANKPLVNALRNVKSAILYVEVAEGKRDQGLSDAEIEAILRKEAKKRQESAELYEKGGSADRAEGELYEKKVIEAYLPQSLDEHELEAMVDAAISELQAGGMSFMGPVISLVKERSSGRADGAMLASLVKNKLSS